MPSAGATSRNRSPGAHSGVNSVHEQSRTDLREKIQDDGSEKAPCDGKLLPGLVQTLRYLRGLLPDPRTGTGRVGLPVPGKAGKLHQLPAL